jgi:hypothetical protein
MKEQLELIARTNDKPGCYFSRSPLADTWFVNLRITESPALPFVHCDECPRQTCFRFEFGKWRYST